MGYLIFPTFQALRFAIFVMGFTATASQVLIIRELLVLFQGNEIFIGIIFGYWLIFQAFGSYFTGKKLEFLSNPVVWFSLMQFATGLVCPLVLLLIRAFRYLFSISTGEVLGIHYVLLLSFLALFPVSFLGALFPLGCSNLRCISPTHTFPSKVYLYEAFGSFVAGLVFVFYFVYYLSPMELALIILCLNLCSVTLYLTFQKGAKAIRNLSFLFFIFVILSFSLSLAERLNEFSSNLLWYEHTLVTTRNSPYANISVIKQEEQHTFFVNGTPYAVFPDPDILTEEFAHFGMLFHEKPDNVLVIGAGFAGLLEEITKYPTQRIDYAEPDPVLIETFNTILIHSAENTHIREKIKVNQIEGRIFLRKTENLYDLILINLPMPITLQLNRYYSAEFFSLAKGKLKEDGLLVVKLPGSEVFLPRELKSLNNMIYLTLSSVFPYVRVIAGEQNIFIASADRTIKTVDEKILTERLNARNVSSKIINEWYLSYKINEPKFKELERELISAKSKGINQDTNPRAVFEAMLFLNSAISPSVVKILRIFENINILHYLMLIGIILIILLSVKERKGQMSLTFAIGSTGFMSMLVSVLLVLLFQIQYGYVYHYIGVLTSLFMLGSAFGAHVGRNISKKYIIKVEIGILILLGFLYVIVLFHTASVSHIWIFVLMTVTGFLTGVEFPLAINIADSYKATSKTAGRFYAIDLFGAFLGAVFPAIVLIPVLGLKNTILITFFVKLASFITVVVCFGKDEFKPEY